MKTKIILGAQRLAGLMLLVFGLNGFLQFMPMPPMQEAMNNYMAALVQAQFIMPIVALIELLVGVSFLINKYVSVMSVILIPIMLNAFLAHLFLDPTGIGGSFVILTITMIVMIHNKERYRNIFKA